VASHSVSRTVLLQHMAAQSKFLAGYDKTRCPRFAMVPLLAEPGVLFVPPPDSAPYIRFWPHCWCGSEVPADPHQAVHAARQEVVRENYDKQ
jgi:hypothetical protein